ncbi:MAG: sialidase family protein, partial [Bacteroidota bacterium]
MKSKIILFFLVLLSAIFFYDCKKKEDKKEVSPLPVVNTIGITSISIYEAACSGEVTSEGASALTAVGFCWDVNPNPTLLRSNNNLGNGTGTFAGKIGSTPLGGILKANTTYFVRAYATNLNGTAYGAELSFKTQADWQKIVSTTSQPYRFFNCGDVLFKIIQNNGNSGSELYKSTDGFTWNICNYNGKMANQSVYIDVVDNEMFWANNASFYRSSDFGASWNLTTFATTLSASPRIFAKINQELYGYCKNDVIKSSDNGITWTSISTNPGLSTAIFRMYKLGNLFFLVSTNALFRSDNSGTSWTKVLTRQVKSDYAYSSSMVESNGKLFLNTGDIFVSNDQGLNWTQTTSSFYNSCNDLIAYNNSIFGRTSSNMYN